MGSPHLNQSTRTCPVLSRRFHIQSSKDAHTVRTYGNGSSTIGADAFLTGGGASTEIGTVAVGTCTASFARRVVGYGRLGCCGSLSYRSGCRYWEGGRRRGGEASHRDSKGEDGGIERHHLEV